MADTSPMVSLLDRANIVFKLAHSLGWEFEKEHREQGPLFMTGADSTHERHREKVNQFIIATRDMRDAIEDPPEGFEAVAEQLRKADKLARLFKRMEGWDILGQWPDLNQVAYEGHLAIKEVTKARRLDYPRVFLDEPHGIKELITQDVAAASDMLIKPDLSIVIEEVANTAYLPGGSIAVGAESKPPENSGHSTNSRRGQQFIWLAHAMLLVREHPDWSNAAIAKEVGKSASTLSRSKEFKSAAALARGNKSDRHKGHVTIDPETGQQGIEAYTDDPAERDWDA